MVKLAQDQCQQMIADGEVPEAVRSSARRVAVVLTQSWCPDWLMMQRYLARLDEPELEVYYVEYDKEPFFAEMMAFKEMTFASYEIPYVRYFVAGTFVGESNLVFSKRGFLKRFTR